MHKFIKHTPGKHDVQLTDELAPIWVENVPEKQFQYKINKNIELF